MKPSSYKGKWDEFPGHVRDVLGEKTTEACEFDALGSPDMQAVDEIWILVGDNLPLVLRLLIVSFQLPDMRGR